MQVTVVFSVIPQASSPSPLLLLADTCKRIEPRRVLCRRRGVSGEQVTVGQPLAETLVAESLSTPDAPQQPPLCPPPLAQVRPSASGIQVQFNTQFTQFNTHGSIF